MYAFLLLTLIMKIIDRSIINSLINIKIIIIWIFHKYLCLLVHFLYISYIKNQRNSKLSYNFHKNINKSIDTKTTTNTLMINILTHNSI